MLGNILRLGVGTLLGLLGFVTISAVSALAARSGPLRVQSDLRPAIAADYSAGDDELVLRPLLPTILEAIEADEARFEASLEDGALDESGEPDERPRRALDATPDDGVEAVPGRPSSPFAPADWPEWAPHQAGSDAVSPVPASEGTPSPMATPAAAPPPGSTPSPATPEATPEPTSSSGGGTSGGGTSGGGTSGGGGSSGGGGGGGNSNAGEQGGNSDDGGAGNSGGNGGGGGGGGGGG